MNPEVDIFIGKHENFSMPLNEIREIILSTNLEETIKWGMPTYTLNNKNIVGIGAFKTHYGVWFFQGGLLKDTHKVLINAQEGKTQAMRQWRFTKDSIIDKKLLLSYLEEAISNEKKGYRINPTKKTKPLIIPVELSEFLVNNTKLAYSFNSLSISKRKEFAEYINTAKKVETKVKRLEKITPMILNNIGLNDKYR
jgi:uncharacterized protein YdeI (YjbR/CyaY-like superfamily)